MEQELQKKLIEKYPHLCQDTKLSIQESCMAWGFEIGDGWHKLFEELCEKLSKFDDVTLAQVKEKFGLLRVYINGGSDEVWDLVNEYENKSGKICETCGEPGKMRGRSWVYTACDPCDEKFKAGKRP